MKRLTEKLKILSEQMKVTGASYWDGEVYGEILLGTVSHLVISDCLRAHSL